MVLVVCSANVSVRSNCLEVGGGDEDEDVQRYSERLIEECISTCQ